MKIFTLLFVSAVLLNASYDKAQKYYETKEYAKAIAEAKASTDEYSNPKLHLLWAKSAEALGEDNQAMAAYERVEILDEQNVDARVALAKLYKRTSRDDLAKEEAQSLQNYQLTPQQRSSLDIINAKSDDLNSFKVFGDLSFGYDSNINVAPSELDINSSSQEISTGFARFLGSLSYINELESKSGWYVRADLNVYNQSNIKKEAQRYDLLFAGLSGGFGYSDSGLSIYVPFGYDYVHYLDKSLLSQLKVKPVLNYTMSSDFIVNFNLSYIQRRYSNTADIARNDSSYGIGTGLYYIFGKNFVYLNAKYDDFSKEQSSSTAKYIDKSYLTSNVGINYNLTSWLVTRADYRFRLGSYEDGIRTSSEKRSDSYNQVEVKFSHYFKKHYELFLKDRYVKNNSNLDTFTYKKNILLFGYSANY